MAHPTVCIIGGSGFIGTELTAALLEAGHSVRIVDLNPRGRFATLTLKADVRDIEQLRTAIEGEVIINLAAEHRDDVKPLSRYTEVNVHGAENVCRVAAEKRIDHVIFTSSVAVYGFAPPGTGEHGEIRPFNEYGRTKFLAEEVYRRWYTEDETARTLTIVRPTVVFGEENRGNVYNLMYAVASNRYVQIGSGSNVKSMAYVKNVAGFLRHALTFQRGYRLYNYVDGPDFSTSEIVSILRTTLGKPADPPVRLPYPVGLTIGYVADAVANITGKILPISSIRVQKLCATTQFASSATQSGFVPPVPLDEALKRTLRHEFLQKPTSNEPAQQAH